MGSVGWCAVSVLAAGCGAEGLQNPSFEEAGASVACGVQGVPTAASWEPICVNLPRIPVFPSQRSGTGFVPTDGQYFMALPAQSELSSSTAGIRQDDVDLSAVTELRFDYEAVGTVPQAAGGAGVATLEMLFTAQGTTSLWSKSFPVGTVADQARDVTVPIAGLATAGRLTIQLTVIAAPGVGLGAGAETSVEVRLDNLRTQ